MKTLQETGHIRSNRKMAVEKRRVGKKRPGRPRTGTRPVIALRVHENVYREIVEAAEANRNTISEEAAARIGMSFVEEHAYGGAAGRQIVNLMASSFIVAGGLKAGSGKEISQWIKDPECFRTATLAVCEALLRLIPEDERMMVAESLKGRVATRIINNGGNQ